MKHYLPLCACMLAASAAAGPTVNLDYVKGTPSTDTQKVTHRLTRFNESLLLSAPISRAEETIKIKPELTAEDNAYFSIVVAVGTDADGEQVTYGSSDAGSGFEFELPAGSYDLVAMGFCDELAGVFLLVQENVKIDASTAVSFNSADATHRTEIERISPSGVVQTLPTSADKGNCSIGDAINLVTYNGKTLLSSDVWLFGEGQTYARSNFESSKFGLTRVGFLASKEGMLYMIIPVDFSKDKVGTNASNWQTAEYTFEPTPLNVRADKLDQESGYDLDELTYTFSMFSLTDDGQCWGTGGMGINGLGYDSGKVCLWAPEDYDGPYAHYVYPLGDVFCGDDSGVKGRPVTRSENGLRVVGVNVAFDDYMYFTNNSRSLSLANPKFDAPAQTVNLANCAPSLINVPMGYNAYFNFIGRHGEAMSIDSWDIYNNVDPDFVGQYGGQTNSVVVKYNGTVVTDNRSDYPNGVDWEPEGTYEIEYSTHNILIDGNVNGLTSGTLTFNNPDYDLKLPSLTLLQFAKGGDGTMTDRFASVGDKPQARFYAAVSKMGFNEDEMYVFYELETPKSVKLEWAPMGTGDFTEVEAVCDPAEFYSPGYGAYYEADLSGVNKKAVYGWYDLRITVEDNNGSTQSQTISPAFNIADMSGIESVMTNEIEDAPVSYFNLQGQRVDNPQRGQLLIRYQGGKSSKMIMK